MANKCLRGVKVMRVILHADANSFYASVEVLYRPWLMGMPVAVAGDPEARHGIILTATSAAKKGYGIKVGMTIRDAKERCPGLICLPPQYELYIYFSRRLLAIYHEYSDRVESFGLDEAWIDISNPGVDLVQGEKTAHEIRERVKRELGITVSVGVAQNKIFAKLGSDVKKPDAVTVIPTEVAWELPVSALLYVGPATERTLLKLNIKTIGELARCDDGILKHWLKKPGLMLKLFALGGDESPVMPTGLEQAIKSIGNSTTTPRDIRDIDDAKCVYSMLTESVVSRMAENGVMTKCISISIRTTKLEVSSCQRTVKDPTQLYSEVFGAAMELFEERYRNSYPLRSAGLSCGSFVAAGAPVQLDLFGNHERRKREADAAKAVESARNRYGQSIILRGRTLTIPEFAAINPREEHTIHPEVYYRGG